MRNFSNPIGVIAAIFCFATSQSAHANVGQEFGFGSRTGALAGAGVAWGAEGYFAYHNPAALPLLAEDWIESQPSTRLRFTYSLLYAKPEFTPIDNVLVENFYVSDKDRYAGVDTNYRATFGQTVGVSYLAAPNFGNLSFGIIAFLPFEQLAYFDTGETFVPEYFLYRARTQRPQFEIGSGIELGSGFRAGAGIHIAYTLTANATVFLQSGDGRSTMRFSGSLKPKAVPFLGVHYSNPKPSNFAAGAVVRFPIKSNNSMVVNTGAHIFPNLRGLDFNFTASSALFYDPFAVESGISWEVFPGARTYLQADYEAWSKFEAPAILINDVELTGRTDNTGVIPNPGFVPPYPYRDIVVPRIAEEISLSESSRLRVGYAYRRGIISEIPTGAGNYLDPDKHIFTAGLGFSFKSFLSWNTPCTVDFHGTYQKLKSGHVEKTPGNEAGDLSDSKIGSPGYDFGGKILGGGVSLSLAL